MAWGWESSLGAAGALARDQFQALVEVRAPPLRDVGWAKGDKVVMYRVAHKDPAAILLFHRLWFEFLTIFDREHSSRGPRNYFVVIHQEKHF